MPEFASAPLWMNLSVFAAAAGIVWIAGTLIARYADTISRRTGIGHAALGILLLGGITSLPEAAVTVTAAVGGNVELAVNNLFGGIAMQVAILAVADVAIGRAALTAVVPNPIVLLQGAFNILLLSIAVCGIVVGDKAVLGIGLWLWLLLAVYLYGVRLLARSETAVPWRPIEGRDEKSRGDRSSTDRPESPQLGVTVGKTVAAGLAIVVAGYVLSKSAEAIAEQTGLGSSFVAVLGTAVTALFTIGLLERRDRTVLRMGYDSAAVLISYFGGLVILYYLRTP